MRPGFNQYIGFLNNVFHAARLLSNLWRTGGRKITVPAFLARHPPPAPSYMLMRTYSSVQSQE